MQTATASQLVEDPVLPQEEKAAIWPPVTIDSSFSLRDANMSRLFALAFFKAFLMLSISVMGKG